jgi:hypothetical protein
VAKAVLEIRSLARVHSRFAIRVLKEVAQSKDAPAASRVAAASELLSRGWGKPQQSHDLTGESEIRVTIRHLVEGMPDTTQLLDISPNDDDDKNE